MLNRVIVTRYKTKWKEIVFNNYDFSANQLIGAGWGIGGNVVITNEGNNNTNCAKLDNQYSGLYKDFNINVNQLYKFEVIAKAVTATNLQLCVQPKDSFETIQKLDVFNSNSYKLYSLEFVSNINNIRIACEIYPGTGTFYINQIRLFTV